MGNNLLTARKQRGLTQESLAEMVGISRVHISDLERGAKPSSLYVAINLVNALALTDAQAMALLRELAAAGAPAAEPPPATTPAPQPRQEAA